MFSCKVHVRFFNFGLELVILIVKLLKKWVKMTKMAKRGGRECDLADIWTVCHLISLSLSRSISIYIYLYIYITYILYYIQSFPLTPSNIPTRGSDLLKNR